MLDSCIADEAGTSTNLSESVALDDERRRPRTRDWLPRRSSLVEDQ